MSSDVGERTYVGRRVRDRYRIVGELGSGALGTVCVAEDETTAQRVAIRFLPRDLAATPSVVRAVQSMGRSIATASAGHAGLVRVLELGEAEPGQPFAVMELLEGRLLSDVMTASRTLDVGRARRWALGLGDAVEALHSIGLVYGRLRPRNVMVLPDGRVKLMDVEVTGLLGGSVPQNVLDLSPAEYLAPEQIRRAPVTEKTDIYAFAAMVYEMFSGAPPFQAPARDAVITKHLSEPAPPMARRHASGSVGRIVMQALEKDPELRPWMHEMLNGLWERPTAPETRGWKRPVALGAGVAFATLIAAVGIWGLLALRQPVVHSSVQPPVPPAEQAPTGARTTTRPPASTAPALTRTESAAKPSAPMMAAAPAMTVTPPPVPPTLPARPTPSAPAAEPRLAPVPATLPSPSQVSTEPVKAPPPAAPPAPRVAAVPSGGLSPAPVSAEMQPHRRTYRVGWLDSGRATAQYQEIVKQALVGYPRAVAFEYRSADGQTARLQGFAAELVQLKVDVLFAVGNQAIQTAKQATTTIPIVMLGSDAVRRDESNANMTGVTYSSADLALGWLSLLKEIRPLSRVAVVSGPDPASRAELANLQTAAATAGAKIVPYLVQDGEALGGLFAGPPAERAEAIIVPGGPLTLAHLSPIVALAGRAKVPAVYGSSEFVEAGGLLAYGPSTPAMYRRAGAYIGKILSPTNPRDLPIEQPSRFELVVNLKTARELGLTLPPSLVLRADRVLQ